MENSFYVDFNNISEVKKKFFIRLRRSDKIEKLNNKINKLQDKINKLKSKLCST